MKKFFSFVLLAALAFSCEQAPQNNEQAGETANETTQADANGAMAAEATALGVAVDPSTAISLTSLDAQMEGKDSIEDVTLKGKVAAVCQMKGCWMTLEKEDGSTIRVTFKDYDSVVMPKDAAGKEVVIHGKALVKTTSVETLKHLAQDEGKSEEEIAAITAPETSIGFVADGVAIQ